MSEQLAKESTGFIKIGSIPNSTCNDKTKHYPMQVLNGWKKKWVRFKIRKHIFFLALKNYRSIPVSIKVIRQLYLFKQKILGVDGSSDTRLVEIDKEYYHSIFAPGFPSLVFDNYITGELNRIRPINRKCNRLSFLFLAVTKKCPLRCEHCYEWDNLNQKETLGLGDLQDIVKKFQGEGVAQFHLGGGEPMARIKDLLSLAKYIDKKSEIYILTSGFNFTQANAKALKEAGVTGIEVSLDHFDAEKHNAFRGFQDSFGDAINAIEHAQQQKLVVSVSICATKEFLSWNNLMEYVNLIKRLGVPFLNILEPKAVGHYKDKDVCLDENQIRLLEQFYKTINFDPAYKDYPVITYTGYHQRRVGCLLGGNRILYIDSDGFVNACPFCHTRNFNIKTALAEDVDVQSAVKLVGCKPYGLEKGATI